MNLAAHGLPDGPQSYPPHLLAGVGIGIFPWDGHWPALDPTVFLAEGARLVGKIVLRLGVSLWFNAVARGDVNTISIGADSNVQDNATLHVTHEHPLVIGNQVVIGHAAVMHGCRIGDRVLVGMGAIVLDGAEIGSDVFLAAGAVVPPGICVPSGVLLAGVPARVIRQLSAAEIASIPQSAEQYREYARTMLQAMAEARTVRDSIP